MEPTTTSSAHKAWASLVILVLFLVVISFLLYRNSVDNKQKHNKDIVQVVNNGLIETKTVNLALAQDEERFPETFPLNFPLSDPQASITESYSMDYKDRGVVLAGISYTTRSQSEQDAYAFYSLYMSSEQYILQANNLNADAKVRSVIGMKDNHQLNVLIGGDSESTVVNITYITSIK